jgi:tetratricopeptide (TPR) repeat protein
MHKWGAALMVWLILALGAARAGYLTDCQYFYQVGDLASASGACRLATIYDPSSLRAWQLVTRVLIAAKRFGQARRSLARLKSLDPQGSAPALLGARLDLAEGQPELALATLARLHSSPSKWWWSAQAWLQLAQTGQAVRALERELAADPASVRGRLLLARLLLPTQPSRSLSLLGAIQDPSAAALSQIGITEWALGRSGAVHTLESAIQNPAALSGSQYRQALGVLTLAYFGTGQFQNGNLALGQLASNEDLTNQLLHGLFPVLLLLLALLVLHLLGESRIEPLATPEALVGPQPWGVLASYRQLLLALLLALIVSSAVGSAVYGNLLALWTPVQSELIRPIFLITWTLAALALLWPDVQRRGWKTWEMLVNTPRDLPAAALLGLAWAALSLGYAYLTRSWAAPWGGTVLPLQRPGLALLLTALVLPLSELYFRSYALFPLQKRYGPSTAVAILALLYALVLGIPLPLLLVESLLLSWLARWENSTATSLVARWGLYLGLFLAALIFPATRLW